MKLSEFLAWWGAFVKENCDGMESHIRIPSEILGVFMFRFSKESTLSGESKILHVQYCATQEMIDSPGGLDELSSVLKGSIEKLKAEERKTCRDKF